MLESVIFFPETLRLFPEDPFLCENLGW